MEGVGVVGEFKEEEDEGVPEGAKEWEGGGPGTQGRHVMGQYVQ